MTTVREHLMRRFDTTRVVVWRDPDGDYADEVGELDLPGIETCVVRNDEFGVKARILRGGKDAKYLIYRSGAVPGGIGNWLFDLELAYGIFTADRASLLAEDLGLRLRGLDGIVAAHEAYFKDPKRVTALKKLLDAEDHLDRVRAKMSAVVLGQSEHSLSDLVRSLLLENAERDTARFEALAEVGLDEFLWAGLARIYGYESSDPSLDDFVLWMFKHARDGWVSDRPGGLRNIQLDFEAMRHDRRSADALSVLANRASLDLDYGGSIEGRHFTELVEDDVFEETEQKIVSDLARGLTLQQVGRREVTEIIRKRRLSVWFERYRLLYEALGSASELLAEIDRIDLTISSFDQGLERYTREWYRIDQLYRRFNTALRTAEHTALLEDLRRRVEAEYTGSYLFVLGTKWQEHVDLVWSWTSATLPSQASFYADKVAPLVRSGEKKAVVIISDALRYEVADELTSLIRKEDKFDAGIEAMLGVLPSYTQLGMAALLPHQQLAHSPKGDPVLVDGHASNGTENRSKLLANVGGTAIQAEDFTELSPAERRDLYRDHQVLYVYHNRIDAIGDKQATERRALEAAQDTLRELVDLVKKLASANATNIFITADHGFLFQHDAVPAPYQLSTQPQGDSIEVKNRRYVLGRSLKRFDAFTTFTPEQLGLSSDLEVQIPKSISRLKVAGGGLRFVHGGASLQEIVVPVVTVNKKRKSDTRKVEVKILPETDKITTGQIVVKLFQAEVVTEKVQARTLRAGIYGDGELISNRIELVFDRDEDDRRDRYQSARMLLSEDADAYNNRTVEFRLEEQVTSSHWRVYAKMLYTLRRSFTSDFDF